MAVERLKQAEKILLVAQVVQLVTSLGVLTLSLRTTPGVWCHKSGGLLAAAQKPVFQYNTLHFPLL